MVLNLITLMDEFNTDEKCYQALKDIRWPDGAYCPKCGDLDVTEMPKHKRWQCNGCGRQFRLTSGTIMHNSHLPLRKWFIAIHQMMDSRKGMSANQLARALDIQYKTAWHLCHRIRKAMANRPLIGPTLVGTVEIDETWIAPKHKHMGKPKTKILVAGALQR